MHEALKLAKEKEEKNGTHEGSKVLKREIAHTSKAIIQKRESHNQRSIKNIRIRKKYSTHLHIVIKVYDSHLLGSGF